ncbi:MAG: TetR/AcrR family transcriptional regulator [Magnetococcales bacterium]|nr:TetR/AcrR family transcriptional regulator [Magnetococcales bacterium]
MTSAFETFWRKGFQGAGLTEILKQANLTKGALYHHFPDKKSLGYAVVEEVMGKMMEEDWLRPIREAEDPLLGLEVTLQENVERYGETLVQLGCPINALAQEMAPVDEGFRIRMYQLLERWRSEMSLALQKGRELGIVREEIDPHRTSVFILATLEGCAGLARNTQRLDLLVTCAAGLTDYFRSLRTPHS